MRWTIPSLLAFALLAAVGCGDAGARPLTRSDYRAALHEIETSQTVRDVDRRFFQLAAGDVTGEECRVGSGAFAKDVRGIVDAVRALDPPADAEDLQARFLVAADRTADEIDRLADDVARGRVACGMPWNRRAYGLSSTDEAARVLAEYARRGYLLDINTGD